MATASQNERALYDRPIDDDRRLKLICIGAGYSGILTAIRFPQRIQNLDLVIYEKNDDIGGTWYENRYPGIACDIPAHVYQFTFASNPSWSRFYAPGGEIWSYLKDLAWKYDVEKYVRLRRRFEKAVWDEECQLWRVTIRNLETDEVFVDTCNILLKGTGILNAWAWPDIPGLHDFQGQYMHTAKWDESFDWTDKTVALIGAGSSGIQILPQIQPKAKRVVHFMKGKNWISPVGYGAEEGGGADKVEHSEEERQHFAENPEEYKKYRHRVEGGMNRSQLVTFSGTPIQKMFWKMSADSMKEKLKTKPEIYSSMTPEYPPGCRRLTPGPGYLEALVEDNVDFIGTGIAKVDAHGLWDNNGKYHKVDAIIYATGFDYSSVPVQPIICRGGIALQDAWTPRPKAYLSLCTPSFPNLFHFLGPNGGPAAGSFIAIEHAQASFLAHADQYFQKTIFTYKCRSWFKRNVEDGDITGLWPGSSVHAQRALANPRFEEFHYVQDLSTVRNKLSWLGNGLTTAQEEDGFTAEYLDNADIPPAINISPRPDVNVVATKLEEVHVNGNGLNGKVPDVVIEELVEAQVTIPS
ncbi:Putative flavin monooxygenase, FAD/NAD(P)-binding domain superfamily [Septoria linicola]|uniref:Flavin monooxygenase, FAD/NAD(P)-binding domain superfamily n=1 Tax=Septoria linicola TaxID=215465 RepID=A0A9Q9ARW6_9PEZI|nr:Putative flavin monooxygenase, FAD/NAD(P)-binding domain superfamily [Septoria linicola]